MKKLFLLLLLALPLHAQNRFNVAAHLFAGAPTGACQSWELAINTLTGAISACSGGSWVAVGGGVGTPSSPSGSLQYNNSGSFGGFGSTNGTGLNLTVTNPTVSANDTSRYLLNLTTTFDSTTVQPVFANQLILANQLTGINGQNQYNGGTNAKQSFFNNYNLHQSYAAGQHFNNSNILNVFGMGDAFNDSRYINTSGGLSANGDEGTAFSTSNLAHTPDSIQFTVTSVRTPATINTTTTQTITKSLTPQTVTVASSAGATTGDWVVLDHGDINNIEAVRLTGVTAGHITGIFRANHGNGVTVKPATVIAVSNNDGIGQGRPIIQGNMTTLYSTGTATPTAGSQTVTGSGGASWSNSMVGGTSDSIGYIKFYDDDIDLTPYGNGGDTLSTYFPIVSVGSTTSLTISRLDVLGEAGYPSNGKAIGGSTYLIAPGALMLMFEDLTTLVLDNNPFTWTVGQAVESVHSANNQWAGNYWRFSPLMPGRYDAGDLYFNSGAYPIDSGITIDGTVTGYGWAKGVYVNNAANAFYANDPTSAALVAVTTKNSVADLLWYKNGSTQVSIGQNNNFTSGNSLVFSVNNSYRANVNTAETQGGVLSLAYGTTSTLRWNGDTSLHGALSTNGSGATLGTTTTADLTASQASVVKDAASADLLLDSYAAISHTYFRRADGTLASPTAVQANDQIGQLRADGYDGSAFGSSSLIAFFASENFSGSARGGYIRFYTITTGTTTLAQRVQVDDSGVRVEALKSTGSAGSKNVVCVDTTTGILYASSTGTDCSN